MVKEERPILPQEGMSLRERQKCAERFKNEVLKSVNLHLRGTPWRRKQSWIFKADQNWYFTAFITGGFSNESSRHFIRAQLGLKPIEVDEIYWRATGLHSNIDKPLSFRSNAAFMVPALPIEELYWDQGLEDVFKVSNELYQGLHTKTQGLAKSMAGKRFSQFLRHHKDASKYHALLWCCLIAEGCPNEAIQAIRHHYNSSAMDDTGRNAAEHILEGFQQVINGTDIEGYRELRIDLQGNPLV